MTQQRKPPPPAITQMRNNLGKFGWCRALQHAWQPPSSKQNGALRIERGILYATFICAHCEGERHDAIALKSGEVVTRMYKMPDGYVLRLTGTKDSRPSKSDWRREHYRALIS